MTKNKLIQSASIAVLTLMLAGGALAATDSTAPPTTAPPAPEEASGTTPTLPNAAPILPSEMQPAAPTPARAAPAAIPEKAEPAATTAAAPALAPEDMAVAEMLRDLIENKLAQHISREHDRAGVRAFYQNRAFAPLWVGNNTVLPRAKAAISLLTKSAATVSTLRTIQHQPLRTVPQSVSRLMS